jgi:tyrosyl-tRNA synthetase
MKLKKIVPVHHHLIASLLKPPSLNEGMEKDEIVTAMKMSKSRPGSAINVFATDEEIQKTLQGAWCPEKQAQGNPVLELVRYMILPNTGKLLIERKRVHGGDLEYTNYSSLEADYSKGVIHPLDMKNGCANALMAMFSKIRKVAENEKTTVLNAISGSKT